MAGGRDIKAGTAYVELTLKETYKKDLTEAERRFLHYQNVIEQRQKAALAAGKALLLQTVKGLRQIGLGLTVVGTATAAVGAGIFAVLAKSVKTFMDVSKHAKEIGNSLASAKADKLNTAFQRFLGVLGAVQFRIGEAVAVPLTMILDVLSKLGMMAANFIKHNQALVITLAIVGAVCLVVGAALVALGTAFIFAASAISGAAAILGFIGTAAGAAVVVLMLLAVAALAVAAGWVVMAETSSGAISGLLAAIASGDFLKAWEIITKGMAALWSIAMFGMKSVFFGMLSEVSARMHSFIMQILKKVQALEKATGLNLGSIGLGAAASFGNDQIQNGAKAGTAGAAFDMARAMSELAAASQEARDNFSKKFGGANFKLPGLSALTNIAKGFGTTGSTNSATAGQNRSLNGIEKEQKKSNEHLENILKVLKSDTGTPVLEFAP